MAEAGALTVLPLRLWFKGERTYVHGTDLFNALAEAAGIARASAGADLRLSLHHPITRGVEAVRLSPGTPPEFRPAALLEVQRGSGRTVWAVRETDDRVAERRPYDEAAVTAGAVIEGEDVIQQTATPYTLIERVVALNKRLLDHAGPAGAGGWWFSRLELGPLPSPAAALRLHRATDLGGRLVKSHIHADGERVGAIYFTRKRP